MSHNSGGFFSLNRLFGKKIKHEKTSSMGVSKSTTQTLTRSTTNPDGISPQNKIAPLATIPNAPFEQTFRITIYLPLGQLYVARIGAKTKLSELLSTICTNKSLDSNKFEFKHPTDDNQVYNLSFTVGEVGLSEIKLVPKTIKEDTTVRYRIHSNFSRENRFMARPHTMSSVSPYSSTNSLNSTDSSGIMMNQRVNNNGVPIVPNRKKRIAPRPPSQNSIPENPEKICSTNESNSHNKCIGADSKVNSKLSNLMRQNFHMSSPNLAMNNNMMIKSNEIDINTSVSNSFDRRQSENCLNNNKKIPLSRPLSIQLNKITNDDHSHNEFRSEISRKSPYHSRTPSDTSVINDTIFPEPQPRTRPPINKKKAPAPPPRTVSTNSNGVPIVTPRNAASKSNIEIANDEMMDDKTPKCSLNLDNTVISDQKPTNISKVMLNVNETLSINNKNIGCQEKVINSDTKDPKKEVHSSEKTSEPTSNCKSISVVNLNSSNCEQIDKNDHIAISLQVNEIIDEAVKINQAKINTNNEKCEEHPQIEHVGEINNNNNNDKDQHETDREDHWDCDQDKHKHQIQSSHIASEDLKMVAAEIPIQPVLNETHTFSFHEYNSNSLPTSTSSTLNASETPSTGPESLITSDIEDGYKGNDLEKKRKLEIVKRDSKEDFIESQFEFLKEHLDNKGYIDSDEEKTINFSKRDIISSTMINENSKIAGKSVDKNDVINELTQIISCNRLDTFIKPNIEPKDTVPLSKRSSLKNFQINAYSNTNAEITKPKTNNYINESSSQKSLNPVEPIDKCCQLNAIEDDTYSNVKPDHTFVISKQINRSVSFHSTSASAMDSETSVINSDTGHTLFTTQRCNSFLSLNGHPKHKQNSIQSQENISMGSARQKSSSELSIADTPSLQSIKVMKSILNSSIKMNPDSKSNQISVVNENVLSTDEQICSDAHKTDTKNQKKAWIYQGPPSINFSTWGERPKSTVNIKSDEDYIFGGTSKMAALQKRFSGVETEKRKDALPLAELPLTKRNIQCDSNNMCKLPVVRSVEYKKNMSQNENNSTVADTPDSSQKLLSFRPHYEVTHIVSENSFSKNDGRFLKDRTANKLAVHTKPMHSFQGNNSTTDSMSRVQSFNIPDKTQSINQSKATKEAETEELEKPIFAQFMLRKTGLKEKMFDKNCNADINGFQDEIKPIPKPIPNAPKPPPTLAKPKIRPVSMDNKIDMRGQLLDSIRNFNRDTLKRNVIY